MNILNIINIITSNLNINKELTYIKKYDTYFYVVTYHTAARVITTLEGARLYNSNDPESLGTFSQQKTMANSRSLKTKFSYSTFEKKNAY